MTDWMGVRISAFRADKGRMNRIDKRETGAYEP